MEDIYLPYKPKRRTRAQVAREQGLEPLAQLLLMQREPDPKRAAQRFVVAGGSPADIASALSGAQDIIAEQVSEDERSRNQVRSAFRREAFIESKVIKAKKDSDEAQKYSDYFDWEEPLKRCSSHRLLAMRRGADELTTTKPSSVYSATTSEATEPANVLWQRPLRTVTNVCCCPR